MLLRISSTGTTLVLNANPKRKALLIQMQPFDVDSTNTGLIFVGFGVQPTATVGHSNQGEILLPASAIDWDAARDGDRAKYKQAVWLASSVNNQSVVVEELLE